MRQSRFTEEQMVLIIREAYREPILAAGHPTRSAYGQQYGAPQYRNCETPNLDAPFCLSRRLELLLDQGFADSSR